MEELRSLLHQLCLDISQDQLAVEPVAQSLGNDANQSNSGECPIKSASPSEISSNKKQKTGWVQRIRIENGETEKINQEQEWVIDKLIEVLDFFEHVQIMNEESFDAIEKPLDDLFSALKYLPTESSIGILPTEIKTDIFSYLCDSESFVAASVCLEWKEIMKKRLSKLREIKIGEHCSNPIRCEFGNCFNPEEMIKAFSVVKLDGRLKICYPLKDIDAATFEGLTNVSELIITNDCECGDYFLNEYKEMLTKSQMELLCDTFEQRNEPLESLELNGLSMISLDQDRLINCLFKVKRLLLGDGYDSQPVLNGKSFVYKILQNMSNFKISQLYLEELEVLSTDPPKMGNLDEDLGDALCQVETIYLGRRFLLRLVLIKRMIQNISTQRIKMENLYIFGVKLWNNHNHFSPQDLKNALTKLKSFAFFGKFTSEQLEAVRSIAGVVIHPHVALDPDEEPNWIIKKRFECDTSLFSKPDFKLSEVFH